MPRQAVKKVKQEVKFAFLEFDTESSCEKAKTELSKSSDRFFVDFVGEKSNNLRTSSKEGTKNRPINPMRLFVTNLPRNMTVEKLKLLFPKCVEAHVKRKGSLVGFVRFANAGDTKAGKAGLAVLISKHLQLTDEEHCFLNLLQVLVLLAAAAARLVSEASEQ